MAKKPVSSRKTKRSRKPRDRQWYIARVLSSLVLLAVVLATLLSAPDVREDVFRAVGLLPRVQPPQLVDGAEFGPVSVHFIDVGQGDAVLLEADGEYALIDAGPPEGQDYLLAYLDAVGVERLRYLIMTHPHSDHYGGMQAVVEEIPIGLVILPDLAKGTYPTATTFEHLLKAMLAQNLPAETGAAGAVYPLGEGSITILQDGLESEDNPNLLSLVTLFEAEGLRYLGTGDAEKANERALLEAGADLRCQLLKAGHHGSSTSNSRDFVAEVSPSLVVVCCEKGNEYGHPHVDALASFEQAGATVVNTAYAGTVRAGPDGAGGVVYAAEHPETEQEQPQSLAA